MEFLLNTAAPVGLSIFKLDTLKANKRYYQLLQSLILAHLARGIVLDHVFKRTSRTDL